VNFLKSRIGGMGLDQLSLQRLTAILNCDVMVSPFVYLELPVGGITSEAPFGMGVRESSG